MALNRCMRWAVAAALGLLICSGGDTVASAQGTDPAVRSERKARAIPRVRVYPRRYAQPGPNATRQCRAWLAREYRVSGPVVVPRMHCWWQ